MCVFIRPTCIYKALLSTLDEVQFKINNAGVSDYLIKNNKLETK